MASIVQVAKGTGSSTAPSATFLSATTAGNLLVAYLVETTSSLSSTGTWNNPQNEFGGALNVYGMWEIVGTGATTYSFTLGASSPWVLVIVEINGQLSTPQDALGGDGLDNTDTSGTSGTSTTTAQANEVAVACMAYNRSTSTTHGGLPTGWTEQATADRNVTSGAHATVATNLATATGTFGCTTTYGVAVEHLGVVMTFKTNSNGTTVSSGVVDVGGSGGISPTGTSISHTGITNLGGSGGITPTGTTILRIGAVTFGGSGALTAIGTSVVISGVVTVGGTGRLLSTGTADILAIPTVGDLGGGLLSTAVQNQPSGIVKVGGGAGVLAQAVQTVSTTEVDVGGGSGMLVTGHLYILSPRISVGNKGGVGVANFWGRIGEPGGVWVLVTVWIWRLDGLGVGFWKLVITRMRRSGSWLQL